jgi:hypothetical protein
MEHESLEARVTALEAHVRGLDERLRVNERDAAAARVLAGAADRDVDEIRGEIREFRGEFRDFRRATTGSFNAIREDFNDLREHVDRGFAEMRGKFDAAAAGQQQIADLIQTVIDNPGGANRS